MDKKRLLTRLVSGAVVVAVTAGSALLVSGVAGAVPPAGTLGFNTISPPEGIDTERMSSRTSGPCPSQTKLADLNIVGPIGAPPTTATFPPDNPYPVTTLDFVQLSTTDPFVQQFRNTLRDAAAERGRTIQVGEYHLTTNCLDEFGFENFGTFTAGLIFDTPTHYTVIPRTTDPTPTPTPVPVTPTPVPVTPTPVPVTPTPVPVTPTPVPVTPTPSPTVTATTTNLTVFPSPAFQGLPVFLFAQVAPNNAAGTVQFKDGNTNLGGPVQVNHGFAFRITFGLTVGQHSIRAEFIPTRPTTFKPSTSNTVRVQVNPRRA